jgi:hypothetical protein
MRPYIELDEGRLREGVNQRQGIGWKTSEQKGIFKKITDKGGHYHFSLEDGDRMFLRNVGMDLPTYTAPEPKTTSSYLP